MGASKWESPFKRALDLELREFSAAYEKKYHILTSDSSVLQSESASSNPEYVPEPASWNFFHRQ